MDRFVAMIPSSRNECGPFEGIDTHLQLLSRPFPHHVEMSVARLRALTRAIEGTQLPVRVVRRNECGSLEGIDTPGAFAVGDYKEL